MEFEVIQIFFSNFEPERRLQLSAFMRDQKVVYDKV